MTEAMNRTDENCSGAYASKQKEDASFAMEVFDDAFDAFHPTLSDSNVEHDNFNTCPLVTLPRELRDMIYVELIITGHVKLAQVCKGIGREFGEILLKRGICRLTIDEMKHPRLTPYPKIRKPLADTIQYLELRFKTEFINPDSKWFHDARITKLFGDANIPRKSCHVVIEDDLPQWAPGQHGPHERYIRLSERMKNRVLLGFLGGFEILTIEINAKSVCAAQSLNLEHSELIANTNQLMYKTMDGFLRRYLGACIRVKGSDKVIRYLEFQPQRHPETEAQKRRWQREEYRAYVIGIAN